uniref:Prokineticin domain-containing protein n=1 Tax=Amblyomma maculatum TaxID=34609 RepID=G3MSU1_AMBMU
MANLRHVLTLLAICAMFGEGHQIEPLADQHIVQRDMLFSQDPKQRNDIGGPCRNSNHCRHELCCLANRNHSQSCQPLARIGEHCTEFQIKGGAYPDHCPCLQGICSLTLDRRHRRGGNGTCVASQQQHLEQQRQRQRR